MTGPGVIDQFLDVFSRYIDSGFGLVGGEVASLARILMALDVTLAALFWAWGPGEDVLQRLVRKVLYVGTFAFVLTDFRRLAQLVYDSFATLGVTAAGGAMGAADLMHPGRIAGAGIEAARPLLAAAGALAGFPAIFENFVQLAVLLVSVLVVLAAFFILAVQLFVVIIEFKLTTLAGFVLVPFGLFGRTAFLAERVLGNVMASGVKVLVLAIVAGVGSTLFQGFLGDWGPAAQPTLDQVLALALGALSLLGLCLYAPSIAGGLVSGAPHLGAGSAAGVAMAVGGTAMAGAGLVRSAAGAAATGVSAISGLAALASRGPRGGDSASGRSGGPPPSGPGGSGPGGSGLGGSGPPPSPPRPSSPSHSNPSPSTPSSVAPFSGTASDGSAGPQTTSEPQSPPGDTRGSARRADAGAAPDWARRLKRRVSIAGGLAAAGRAIGSGDHSGGSAAVPLKEE